MIYEDRIFEGMTSPLVLQRGDIVRRCNFRGNGRIDFAIKANSAHDAVIEDVETSGCLGGMQIIKANGVTVRQFSASGCRTYGIASYDTEFLTVEDFEFTNANPGQLASGKSGSAQAFVAFSLDGTGNHRLTLRRLKGWGTGKPHNRDPQMNQGTGDLFSVQFAEGATLEDIQSFDSGELGIFVGGRGIVLRRCSSEGADGSGIQVGLNKSKEVPAGLPAEAVYLEQCWTRGNGLRRDNQPVAAGYLFQNTIGARAVACTADEPLQGAHIAQCRDVKFEVCDLKAPAPLVAYSSINCGFI